MINFNDKEQYINLIVVLQKTLEFYGRVENYDRNVGMYDSSSSLIEKDKGKTARVNLKQVKELLEKNEETEQNYDELLKNVGVDESPFNDSEKNWNDFLKAIEDLKKT